MSRLYDSTAPVVISQGLLNKCLQEQAVKDDSGIVAEGADRPEKELVVQLRLDYKNILRIENLWEFQSLTKLQLDNNIIEKIQGLETLVHLEWLDLSFNNIEIIEGLDTLTKLKDLSLARNRIQTLQGLDKLNDLHVLSVGHNQIKDTSQMKYLRQFRGLETLNVTGNPCADDECCLFVVAHLPWLVYLNYRRVTEQSRTKANEQFQEVIEALEQKDHDDARQAEEERDKRDQEDLHRRAYVNGVSGEEFVRALFAEDGEAGVINNMTQVQSILDVFCEVFMENCAQVIEIGLRELKKRDEERRQFSLCVEEAIEVNRQQGIAKVNKLVEFKKQVLELDGDDLETKIVVLESDVLMLKEELLDLEIQLAEQLEEVTKEFEMSYTELVSGFIEGVQAHFSQCREAESKFTEELTEICLDILGKLAKNELDGEFPEEARMMFVDKESLMAALQTAHDNHALCIDTKEDGILNRAKGDLKAYIEELSNTEMKRNRGRIAEIRHFVESIRDEITQTAPSPDLEM